MSIQNVLEILEQVATTSGRNAKIALLDTLKKDFILREIVEYCYSPMKTYRIVISPAMVWGQIEDFVPSEQEQKEIWGNFIHILNQLDNRSVELSEGKNTLYTQIRELPPLYRKFFSRIVNHDLKIGILTWDKWFPGLIPKEPAMLCDTYAGHQLTANWIIEPKYDGRRAVIIVDAEGNCKSVSRGNKECYNWEHIALEIKNSGIREVILDAEFFAGDFSKTQSICSTQTYHPDKLLLKAYIFDMLTLDEWTVRCSNRTLYYRKFALARFLDSRVELKYVKQVPTLRLTSKANLDEVAGEFYNKGFEGIVIKNLHSAYEWDRSSNWLKLKPENEADLTVIGAEPGDVGDRHANTLGRLICRGSVTYKKKQYYITAKVGGGLEDHERHAFWKMHQDGDLNGLVIEVRYQDVTSTALKEGGEAYSIRFPRFLRVRLDKTSLECGGK